LWIEKRHGAWGREHRERQRTEGRRKDNRQKKEGRFQRTDDRRQRADCGLRRGTGHGAWGIEKEV
jgi:hypothetical protein